MCVNKHIRRDGFKKTHREMVDIKGTHRERGRRDESQQRELDVPMARNISFTFEDVLAEVSRKKRPFSSAYD